MLVTRRHNLLVENVHKNKPREDTSQYRHDKHANVALHEKITWTKCCKLCCLFQLFCLGLVLTYFYFNYIRNGDVSFATNSTGLTNDRDVQLSNIANALIGTSFKTINKIELELDVSDMYNYNINDDKKKNVVVGIGMLKSGTTFFIDALTASNPINLTLVEVSEKNFRKKFNSVTKKVRNQEKLKYFSTLKYIFEKEYKDSDSKHIIFLQPKFGQALYYWQYCSIMENIGLMKSFYQLSLYANNVSNKNKRLRILKYNRCDFNDYIYSNWNMSHEYLFPNPSNIVLTEKTASMMREAHSMVLLMYYANKYLTKRSMYNLKMYCILRNPYKRTRSHFLYHCGHHQDDIKKLRICDNYNLTMKKISESIDNLVIDYPNFYQMIEYMKLTMYSNFNKDLIIKLFINDYYSYHSLIEVDNIYAASCYYPSLLMIEHYFEYFNHGEYNLGSVLKIIQFEHLFQENGLNKIIQQIKCWILNKDLENEICINQYSELSIDQNGIRRRVKDWSSGNNHHKTMSKQVENKLDKIFIPCNTALNHFVKQNPTLLFDGFDLNW